jgi:hypothetical protein
MRAYRSALAGLTGVAIVFVGWILVGSGQVPRGGGVLLEPRGNRGEAIYPALEGWYPNPDGTSTILLGYFNRNHEQILDIPIGPNNNIEPGGPDFGQPTHFRTGRNWGVFAITVPKDFGNKRLTWTLIANAHKAEVTFWLNPPYFVEPFKNQANGNTPPRIRFSEKGPELQGPPRGIAQNLTAAFGKPLPITLWATDEPSTYDPYEGIGGRAAQPAARGRGRGGEPRPDIIVHFEKYRGPGTVTFTSKDVEIFKEKKQGPKVDTMARFSERGEYMVLVTVNDESGSGGGGDQCCWTSAHLRVNVK